MGARALTAAAVGTLCAAAGVWGFRLRPDTFTYARHGLHLRPYPLASIPGALGGMTGVVVCSSVAAALLVYAMPTTRRRLALSILALPWLLFPGMDAIGALLALLAVRRRSRAALALPLLIHPVAAIGAVPALAARVRRPAIVGALLVAVVMIAFALDGLRQGALVGVWAHLLYMTRYLLTPLVLYLDRSAHVVRP